VATLNITFGALFLWTSRLNATTEFRLDFMRKLNKNQIEEIIKEVQTGSSLNQLSSKFGFPKTTIYYHVKEFCRKMNKFDEKRLSEWERGYLVGFFIGDGCLIYRPKCWSYITKFVLNALSEKAIANSLINILPKAGTKPWTATEGHRLKVLSSSKGLQDFLKRYAGYGSEDHKLRKRFGLSETLNEGKVFTFGVLAGMIDSDGHVRRGKGHGLSVVISTASKGLATSIVQLVGKLGMKATIIRQHSGFTGLNSCFLVRILTNSITSNAAHIRSLKLQQVLNEC
jgi:hypothetical protein